ncbi:SpoIIE family protein phosphatase [Actinokineospora globicatena]|uniref:SpoIIE family protein phosphatase n=1 Tax=Actinokineospora globicatena TaxID=103729 RepID=UPI0020A57A24|nr:SpoIIE family protein phosphatase [Actinokineospora globicatena]MCP2302811.1 anti-anti-sigma factor [Actinokineospora globicatena]GLW78807.1 bifunctional protein kinase/phosphatase [Actinokineospora globicatena]GLW84526.1 bifunctional protein kinase/phosphatase [Actinokineospora globicatena]
MGTGAASGSDAAELLGALEPVLQPLDAAEDVVAAAVRMLGEYLGVDRCAYARAEADEDHFVMSGDHSTGLPPLPGRFAMSAFGAGALTAMRGGEPWVVVDSATDERLVPADLDAYRVTGIRAVICFPLHKAGRFVAAMAVHQAVPRVWTREEIETVGVVVARCWESLQRVHAGQALREGEQRYRMLFERATDGVWIVDHQLRYVEVNPAGCALFGATREQILGRTVRDFLAEYELDRLAALQHRLAQGEVTTEVWDVRRGDGEMIALELAAQVTPTGMQAIGRDVTARRRAEAERELLLRREHEIAEALQRSLLPRELPRLARLATAARYLPAARYAQAGGDWYEVLPLTDTVVALSVGDVVGKGPTAAAVMGQLRSALAGYLLDGHTPAAALERLDAFVARTPGAMGSTCACLTFDYATGRLCWSLAGHPPPLVVDGEPRYLTGAAGAVLGVAGRTPYREAEAVLAPGTSVLLYTDGLVERPGVVIDEGLSRLADVAGAAADLAPDDLASRITTTMLDGWHGDDVALVVARFIPPPLRERDVPATIARLGWLRGAVDRWAQTAGLSLVLRNDLHLALGEAAANAVEHAYPSGEGTFDFAVTRTPDGAVEVEVRDRGRWRPEPDNNDHRGRSVDMIYELAEAVSYTQGPTGTTVGFRITGTAPSPELPVGVPTLSAIRLTGAIDLAGAASLRESLLAEAAHGPLTLDLSAVDYLSSSGVALLLEIASVSPVTVFVAPASAPARILALSGLSTALTIRAIR